VLQKAVICAWVSLGSIAGGYSAVLPEVLGIATERRFGVEAIERVSAARNRPYLPVVATRGTVSDVVGSIRTLAGSCS
jgi:hypothetical protein